VTTNKIGRSILKFLDDICLLGASHSEANIGYNESRDISLGEEPALIHASSKEVESRASYEGVIYIEEGRSLRGECHVTTLAIRAVLRRFMLTP
jgi:hypothetical protein